MLAILIIILATEQTGAELKLQIVFERCKFKFQSKLKKIIMLY
jgi:hypothetical protein